MRVTVYVVSPVDAKGRVAGEPIAAKLTHTAAHAVAKTHAPARVTKLVADKTSSSPMVGQQIGGQNGYQGP